MSNKVINYTSRNFASAKASIIEYIKTASPEWTDHLETDFGITLVELVSGIVDMFAFYQNFTATESFPSTARLFESLCRHAEWFGYHPHPTSAAQVDITFTKSNASLPATIPFGTRVATSDRSIEFETTEQLYLPAGIASGIVGAVHGHQITGQIIGASDGSKNQEYKLLSGSVVRLSENVNACKVYVDGVEWPEFPSLVWAAGTNGYRIWVDANMDTWIRFGDGVYGNIPSTGSSIVVDYTTGGGISGNVGAYTLTNLQGSITNISSVTNESAASGGGEAETLEELRAHMPSQVITRGRAVVKDDYKRLVEMFGEIEKVDIYHPSANIVKVYILPQGGSTPSASLLTSVREYLADIRMITEDVQVLAPTFVNVNIAATVVLADDSPDTLSTLTTDLRAYLDQGEFARSLYIHDIYDFCEAYDGVDHITVTLLAKDGDSGINDITTDSGEIITAGTIALSV